VAELIVAFDVATGREALALAQRLPGLGWAKIGAALHAREGPALVREFCARGVRVFLDLKWHDIPTRVAEAVSVARELGVSLATVHTLGGPAMLRAACGTAGEMALVGVTVLTSHDEPEFAQILGRGIPDLGAEVERLARLALGAGLRGVVTSGQELPLVRAVLGSGPWIVVPGIRSRDDTADDQRRTVTPAAAVQGGATHLVVGRPITEAADPAAVYQRFQEAM
jgi:orotidine-5'-phosphate decarboxylase